MESFTLRRLTFFYPATENPVLDDISISIPQGQFVALCGPSGSGKSTLLRQLKPALTPHGRKTGEIFFEGTPLQQLDARDQSAKIGFVMQSPENQIVTDKVWHELAFGLESLGHDTETIRRRVAEMASFFGIESWFYKNVAELSGGQKQLLNLASIMAMQPSALILDEPTSQLDPIAAADFIATVGKINRELGATIIITEHRLEEVFPFADRAVVMEGGKMICDGTPAQVGQELKSFGHSMFFAMPTPMRVWAAVPSSLSCPVTIRDGRRWIDRLTEEDDQMVKKGEQLIRKNNQSDINDDRSTGGRKQGPVRSGKGQGATRGGMDLHRDGEPVIEIDEVWFRYEKEAPDILKGLSCKVYKGEFLAILGGNGAGKTTMLSLMSGRQKPYRGSVKIQGVPIEKTRNLYRGIQSVLPQNPQSLFLKKTVREDLLEMLSEQKMAKEEKEDKLRSVAATCRLNHLMHMHPYDLSGGEQQRAALAKVLLTEPEILMLDEPTKGFDAEFKILFAEIISDLMADGVTIIMVSHDVEFCAKYAHRCAMVFDGMIVSADTPRKFFAGNSFYTTSANRMVRHIWPEAVTAEDIIEACGGDGGEKPLQTQESRKSGLPQKAGYKPDKNAATLKITEKQERKERQKKPDQELLDYQVPPEKRALTKRTLAAVAMALIAIPLTLFAGIYYLNDRQYYIISILIIFEAMLPFVMIFEGRKPQARELVIISVLCAIGVAGRTAFFMLPQFKPVAAMAIIAGVAFGGEAGFLFGAVTGFVSNFFYGQGPWTPWQMLAYGMIGFLAGVLFRKGVLRRSRAALSTFGGLSTFLIYGGLMNASSVLIFQGEPTKEMFIAAYVQGIPFDLIHAGASVFFLWLISDSFLQKLDRIKLKYGLLESSPMPMPEGKEGMESENEEEKAVAASEKIFVRST